MLNSIYNLFFRRLFSFRGRTSRKGYIARFLLTAFICITWVYTEGFMNHEGILPTIYFIIMFVLTDIYIFQYFPLAVRRLHDMNSSGWWVLLSFVPFGQLVILWLMFKKGTPGPNNYGKSSDNYNESYTTLKYNLLVFGGILLSSFSFGFYLQSIQKDREQSLLLAKISLEYYKREDYDESLKGLNLAISFTPKEPYLYNARGDVLLKLKRYDEALQDYDKVIELIPNKVTPTLYHKKIFVLFKQSNYNEALKICDLLLEMTNDKDDFIYVYTVKANILNKIGKYNEALAYTEKVLSLDPNNKKAMTIKKQAFEQLKVVPQ